MAQFEFLISYKHIFIRLSIAGSYQALKFKKTGVS